MNARAFFFMLLILCARVSLADAGCPSKTAALVEQKAAEIDSWENFAAFYRQYAACDRSALSSAYTDAVVHVASKDEGLVGLSTMLKAHPKLRGVVLRHLRSEAITTDDQVKILKNTQVCGKTQRALCKSVADAMK